MKLGDDNVEVLFSLLFYMFENFRKKKVRKKGRRLREGEKKGRKKE